jgi:hypothetical protein
MDVEDGSEDAAAPPTATKPKYRPIFGESESESEEEWHRPRPPTPEYKPEPSARPPCAGKIPGSNCDKVECDDSESDDSESAEDVPAGPRKEEEAEEERDEEEEEEKEAEEERDEEEEEEKEAEEERDEEDDESGENENASPAQRPFLGGLDILSAMASDPVVDPPRECPEVDINPDDATSFMFADPTNNSYLFPVC